MKILLTAFNAFGSLTVNPSQVIVEDYVARWNFSSDCQIRGEVLETAYGLAEKRIVELLDQFRPDVLLMFGVAQKRRALSIERRASNWDAVSIPDNAGEIRVGQPILESGPVEFSVTIPAEQLVEALRRESIPAELSDDAGAFVCNHSLYAGLNHARKLGGVPKCGFVHIPLPVELQSSNGHSSGVTFGELLRAVDVCVRFLQEWQQGIVAATTTG